MHPAMEDNVSGITVHLKVTYSLYFMILWNRSIYVPNNEKNNQV